MATFKSSGTDKDVKVQPTGTGKVVVGTGAAAATVASDGDNDLVLQTGNATTGTITVTDGANGNISLTPNGTGSVVIPKADINGGTIDGTDITGGTIDGTDITGGTIDDTTIGGTTPAAVSATALNVTDNSTGEAAVIKQSGAGGTALRITHDGTSGNALVVEDDTNPDSTPFVVDNTGKVGIGTDSPANRLHIENAGFVAMEISGDGTSEAQILFSSNTAARISQQSNQPLLFATNATEQMRIDSAGKVGIGTGSSILDGRINIANGTIEFDPGAVDDSERAFNFNISSSNYAKLLVPSGSGGALAFWVGGADSATERMRIDNSGNLKFDSGYGSVATAYGCRAWVNFDGTGTVAIRASGNVSSITDNGTGDYTVNFTTAMPDANYTDIITLSEVSINTQAIRRTVHSPNTTSRRFECFSGGGFQDNTTVTFAVFR